MKLLKSRIQQQRSFNSQDNLQGKPASEYVHSGFYWLKLRMKEVAVTTGAIRRAKLQSKCHQQQTNTQLFTGRMLFCHPTNSVEALKGESITLHQIAHSKLTWYLPSLPSLSSAVWCQKPWMWKINGMQRNRFADASKEISLPCSHGNSSLAMYNWLDVRFWRWQVYLLGDRPKRIWKEVTINKN